MKPRSPFELEISGRQLRLTLHRQSFDSASPRDLEALALIEEFLECPEIDGVSTEAGNLPHIELGSVEPQCQVVHLRQGEEWHGTAGIPTPASLGPIAAALVGDAQISPLTDAAQKVLPDIQFLRAHIAHRRDIFVTCSTALLEGKSRSMINDGNPRSPIEAIAILHLLLRSRERFLTAPWLHHDFWSFYWGAMRQRLPELWGYFGACQWAGRNGHPKLADLATAMADRAQRCLIARDEIGRQFYQPQTTETRERMLYHLEYLVMLLSGILDAEAAIAQLAYGVSKDPRVNFQDAKLPVDLRTAGATTLAATIRKRRFRDVLQMVYHLRNSIHSTGLNARRVGHSDPFLEMPKQVAGPIWATSQRLGGPDVWGLKEEDPSQMYIRLDPYSYADTALRHAFEAINDAARESHLELRFPAAKASPNPPQDNSAPMGGLFGVESRRRFSFFW